MINIMGHNLLHRKIRPLYSNLRHLPKIHNVCQIPDLEEDISCYNTQDAICQSNVFDILFFLTFLGAKLRLKLVRLGLNVN